MTAHTLQMFKVKRSKVKVTEYMPTIAKISVLYRKSGSLNPTAVLESYRKLDKKLSYRRETALQPV